MFKGDRRITLQRQGGEEDTGFGVKPGAWVTLATVWAETKHLAAAERVAAMENASFQPARFRIRDDSDWTDLNSKDRLMLGGKPYNIRGVHKPERGFMLIDAVADGSDNIG